MSDTNITININGVDMGTGEIIETISKALSGSELYEAHSKPPMHYSFGCTGINIAPKPFTITKEQYDKDIAKAKKDESLALVNAIHSMIDARMPKYDTTTEYSPDGRTLAKRKVSDFDHQGLRDDINSLIKDYITPKS